MSIFNPEFRESKDIGREARERSKDLDGSIEKMIDDGRESFPDIIGCPNQSCQHPLKIEVGVESIEVRCGNCGFERIYAKKN